VSLRNEAMHDVICLHCGIIALLSEGRLRELCLRISVDLKLN